MFAWGFRLTSKSKHGNPKLRSFRQHSNIPPPAETLLGALALRRLISPADRLAGAMRRLSQPVRWLECGLRRERASLVRLLPLTVARRAVWAAFVSRRPSCCGRAPVAPSTGITIGAVVSLPSASVPIVTLSSVNATRSPSSLSFALTTVAVRTTTPDLTTCRVVSDAPSRAPWPRNRSPSIGT